MKAIAVDFNAMTKDDEVRLDIPCSARDIAAHGIAAGDRVVISDGEVAVEADIIEDTAYRLLAIPDWDTVVYLTD